MLALLALAGCGSSSSTSSSASAPAAASTPAASTPTSSTSSAPTSTSSAASTAGAGSSLSVAADSGGQLKFDKTALTAKAGKVSIDFTNMSSIGHNLTVEGSAGDVGATPTFEGGSKTLAVSLKAGTYKFYCSVPGHRQGGMEGTITVK
jgi:plastocyanin